MSSETQNRTPRQINPWKRQSDFRRFSLYLSERGYIMWFSDGKPGFGGTEIDVDTLVMDTGLLHMLGVPYPHSPNFGGSAKNGRDLLARAIREKLNADNKDFADEVESYRPMTVYYYVFKTERG